MEAMSDRPRMMLPAGALLLFIVGTACSYTPDWARPAPPRPESAEGAEQLDRYFLRIRFREAAAAHGTLGVTGRVRTRAPAGWAGERVWHRRTNDWEPAIAADPSSPSVYQLTTRYGKTVCGRCPDPWIVFRWS